MAQDSQKLHRDSQRQLRQLIIAQDSSRQTEMDRDRPRQIKIDQDRSSQTKIGRDSPRWMKIYGDNVRLIEMNQDRSRQTKITRIDKENGSILKNCSNLQPCAPVVRLVIFVLLLMESDSTDKKMFSTTKLSLDLSYLY